MKLWEKGIQTNKNVEAFTTGNDRQLDLFIAKHDVVATLAHIRMLESIQLITSDELNLLSKELKHIHSEILKGNFVIEEGVEDVHSQLEFLLTKKLGDVGKKVHSGRSRNDQVLVALNLFIREEIYKITTAVKTSVETFLRLSEKHKDIIIPGYTHLQVAMPSSFGLWFGAYAESLVNDMLLLNAAYRYANCNPLGSGAGYGSSFPLNRELTTELLGFESLAYNVVWAQMSRGKTEKTACVSFASVAETLSKFATDACMFMNQNFGYISLPDDMTTGSSIMPHKKNPDVFELIRAKCNKIRGYENTIGLITSNLPSGYFRDMQIVKEVFIPACSEILECVEMTSFIASHIIVNKKIIDDSKYDYLFSVEEVNKKVIQGMSFRDAYKSVADEIEKGSFKSDKKLDHTHAGSIGNLCNDKILKKCNDIYDSFIFDAANNAIEKLLQ